MISASGIIIICTKALCKPPAHSVESNAIQCRSVICRQFITVYAMQSNSVQYSPMQCSAVQCNAVQCIAVQPVQLSTLQSKTVQCSPVKCSMQPNAVQGSAVACRHRFCGAEAGCTAVTKEFIILIWNTRKWHNIGWFKVTITNTVTNPDDYITSWRR
jgi:hypothetical protein